MNIQLLHLMKKSLQSLAILTLLVLGLSPCPAQQSGTEAASSTVTSGFPPKALPSEPGWGYFPNDPKAWMNWHRGLLNQNKKGEVGIVFIGDSLTYGWLNIGKETWTRDYVPLKAVNYGIGGDTTRQLLWRINDGALDGIEPKLVVLMIGTNNLYNDHNSGTNAEIAEGVKKVIELIQTKSPKAKILLLGILPRQTKYFCDRIKEINLLTSQNANGDKIRYLDLNKDFIDAEGKANTELFDAGLVHINAQGYKIISVLLKPVIEEMIK